MYQSFPRTAKLTKLTLSRTSFTSSTYRNSNNFAMSRGSKNKRLGVGARCWLHRPSHSRVAHLIQPLPSILVLSTASSVPTNPAAISCCRRRTIGLVDPCHRHRPATNVPRRTRHACPLFGGGCYHSNSSTTSGGGGGRGERQSQNAFIFFVLNFCRPISRMFHVK